MENDIVYRQAQEADWPLIAGLLAGTGLQLVGAREHLKHFLVALDEYGLVGCAGLEHYGNTALLRSVAVAESERGKGIGQNLVERLLLKAQQEKITTVVLLAQSAEEFFRKFEFTEIRFDRLPQSIHDSVEFKFAAPDATTAMLLNLSTVHTSAPIPQTIEK
jgi:amino-acid N-acetyltransferase